MKNKIYFLLFLLSLFAFAAEIPLWVTIVSTTIAGHAWLALQGRLMTLKSRMIGMIALLAGAVVFWQFNTLFGPEPATALLVILAALKLEELRSLRDAIIYLFIILLLVMYYLLVSQTIMSTIYMLLMIFCTVIAFIITHTPEDKARRILRASPKLVMKDVFLSLPFFIVLFIFFPRFSTPWASFFSKEQTLIGFSDNLSPGRMADLVGSEEPAFRVQFKNKAPKPEEMYWRGIVLDITDGWNWRASNVYQDSRLTKSNVSEDASQSEYEYEITLEPRFNKMLFTLAQTRNLQWKDTSTYNTIIKKEAATYTTSFSLMSRTSYLGSAYVGKVWQENFVSENEKLEIEKRMTDYVGKSMLEEIENEKSETVKNHLKEIVKSNFPTARLREFVGKIKAQSPDALSFGKDILRYFRANQFIYTTDTPEMPELENFLFDQKAGFCEHFASAFASLMRVAGHPARVIIGFQGGEYNDIGDFYLIRDQHAHAWAEVYHEGSWHIFDPTSSVGAIRLQMGNLSDVLPQFRQSQAKAFFRRLESYYLALEDEYANLLSSYNLDVQDELFGIRDRNNLLQYILYFSGGLFFLALSYYLFNIYRLRAKSDPLMEMQIELQKLIRKKGYDFKQADGALTIQRGLREICPAHSEQIDKTFTNWIDYRYRAYAEDKNKPKSIANLQKEMAKLIGSLPSANL